MIFTASPGESHLEITIWIIHGFVIGERIFVVNTKHFIRGILEVKVSKEPKGNNIKVLN